MAKTSRPPVLILLSSMVIVLSACGSSSSEGGDAATPAQPSSMSAPSGAAGATEEAPQDTDVAAPAGDSGTGVVRVDGVEYPGFVGDCSISRGLDPETYEPVPVGDLSEPGLVVVVGIDNVASEPTVEANFIMTGAETFRMVGVGGPGEIDSIAYVGPAPSSDATELAQVAFSGTTDDGLPVVAEVLCEIGLG